MTASMTRHTITSTRTSQASKMCQTSHASDNHLISSVDLWFRWYKEGTIARGGTRECLTWLVHTGVPRAWNILIHLKSNELNILWQLAPEIEQKFLKKQASSKHKGPSIEEANI